MCGNASPSLAADDVGVVEVVTVLGVVLVDVGMVMVVVVVVVVVVSVVGGGVLRVESSCALDP